MGTLHINLLTNIWQVLYSKAWYLNPRWYKEFSCIHYCSSKRKLFCLTYIQSYSKGLLTKKYDEAFVVTGFCNWKKVLERLQRHVMSECHKESVYRLKAQKAPIIKEQGNDCVSKTLVFWREMWLKQLSSIKCLLRQGLTICCHKEIEGNLM